jgi:DNA-binding transcriptional regulator YdaS (Cro superfamily)
MTTKEIIALLGGHAALAKKLGISRQAVYKWGRIPRKRAKQLAEITGQPMTDFRPEQKI